MKKTILILLTLGFCTVSFAQQNFEGRRPRGPQLTEEQKTCIDTAIKQLVADRKIAEGERPSHEIMGTVMQGCGIEKPPIPPHGERRAFKDTNVQSSNVAY